jgi:predicted house-cleaning noncanonical NTP pyrophosphatase (MazG superfamily)
MISFKEFIQEEITDQEVDELIESLVWEDIEEFYEDVLMENISSTERVKMAQRMKSKKTMLAMARRVKLRSPGALKVIGKRAKVDARKLVLKKLLKGRKKSELSAAEKNRLEARVSKLMSMQKNITQKMIPKVKQLERERIASRNKG